MGMTGGIDGNCVGRNCLACCEVTFTEDTSACQLDVVATTVISASIGDLLSQCDVANSDNITGDRNDVQYGIEVVDCGRRYAYAESIGGLIVRALVRFDLHVGTGNGVVAIDTADTVGTGVIADEEGGARTKLQFGVVLSSGVVQGDVAPGVGGELQGESRKVTVVLIHRVQDGFIAELDAFTATGI